MPFAEISTGARLHYEEAGSGTPFILLHGLVGTARTDLGQVMDWLAESYRVIGPSLRGYGQSTPKPRDFPLNFYHRDADDLLAFMDALALEKAHILGYSDGGEVALIAAARQPERFLSVMTIGAVGSFGPELRPAVQRVYPGDWIDEKTLQLQGIDNPAQFTLGWVTALKHCIDTGGDVSLSLAPNIVAPLLMMLGKQDTLNPSSYAQKYVQAAPNGKVMLFDSGHGVHQQDCGNFLRVVAVFLAKLV